MNLLRLTQLTYRIALLFSGITLLCGCNPSHQLGMEDNPQELLERALNDPDMILNPNQSISVMNHGAQLGERNAAPAADKIAITVMGNTGAGKSTTVNCLVGCRMSAEEGEWGEETISVDPNSTIPEVMPIGHGEPSQTFLPQIAQHPNVPNSAYCDCPGFFDNRRPE